MAYLLKQGKSDCLFGEVLVYAKCLESGSVPALFFSSDYARLEKFSRFAGDKKESLEIGVCIKGVLPANEIVEIADVVHAGSSWLEERAVQKCMRAGLAYMDAYFSQIKRAYGFDFDDDFVCAEGRALERNIELVTKSIIERTDARKTSAAASLLRRMAKKRTLYNDLCSTMIAWHDDTSRPQSERDRIILATKDRIVQEEKERRYWEWA